MGRSTADENVRLVREYLDGIDENRYNGELVSDDFVAHVPATLGGDGYTFAERKAVYGLYHEAFPDLDVDVVEVIATGAKVVVRVRLTGTHDGAEFGLDARLDQRVEPTGNEINVTGVGIFTVEDGSITAIHWFVDKLQILAQLGILSE